MAHSVVARERISSAECLFNGAEIAADLDLFAVVDGVLMPGQVIGAREDGTARLSSARVDAIAPVRPGLAVQ